METSEMSVMKGIIIPTSWDTDGNIDKIALATYREEIFILEDKTDVRNLRSFLKKRVVIEGVSKKNSLSKAIDVHHVQEDTSMLSLNR